MIDDKSDAGSWAEAMAFKDAVNPDHYKRGGIEAIDYIDAKLTPEERGEWRDLHNGYLDEAELMAPRGASKLRKLFN